MLLCSSACSTSCERFDVRCRKIGSPSPSSRELRLSTYYRRWHTPHPPRPTNVCTPSFVHPSHRLYTHTSTGTGMAFGRCGWLVINSGMGTTWLHRRNGQTNLQTYTASEGVLQWTQENPCHQISVGGVKIQWRIWRRNVSSWHFK